MTRFDTQLAHLGRDSAHDARTVNPPLTRASTILYDSLEQLRQVRADVPYEGPRSIKAMLEGLRDTYGWNPIYEGDHIIGLELKGANISLEPGGQLELSGAPLATIPQTCDEVNEHLREVHAVGDDIGAAFIGLGAAPIQDDVDEIGQQ